jgi:hypothetical protein
VRGDENIRDSDYCIMGALGFFLERNHRNLIHGLEPAIEGFPTVLDSAPLLIRANPNLTQSQAEDYANKIVEMNDCGEFEEGWNILNEALKAKAPKETKKRK